MAQICSIKKSIQYYIYIYISGISAHAVTADLTTNNDTKSNPYTEAIFPMLISNSHCCHSIKHFEEVDHIKISCVLYQ